MRSLGDRPKSRGMWTAFTLTVLLCTQAKAESVKRLLAGSDCFTGYALGFANTSNLSIDGRRADARGTGLAVIWEIGCSFALGRPSIALITLGRLISAGSEWDSYVAGEFAIGPEYRIKTRSHSPRVEWHLALPIGFVLSAINHTPYRRAVSDDYSSAMGTSFGTKLGVTLSGQRHGFRIDLDAALRRSRYDHTATLRAQPDVSSRERYEVDHAMVTLLLGYSYRIL